MRTTIPLYSAFLFGFVNVHSVLSFRPCSGSSMKLLLPRRNDQLRIQLSRETASPWRQRTSLLSSIVGDEDQTEENDAEHAKNSPVLDYQEQESIRKADSKRSPLQSILDGLPFVELFRQDQKLPPMQVDDTNLLLYDVFLIVNLCLSISFWVTHRMDFDYLPFAFSEGCLLSIFWVLSGLYNGMFLYSAVDGHYGPTDERGGPKAAAILALNTYVNTVNLRLIFAFIVAVAEHRQVGVSPSEQILPLEIGFGLLLMSSWRALHSSITPRI